ncbi:hypothetical protein R3P38DRAFT_972424 [Favolaschia claudopus]|uniref:Uncharacterized protein n=1 Tax=Favolaschia claudopus TaxID=2862362 RepID=A0AAW0E7K4_9AGAR
MVLLLGLSVLAHCCRILFKYLRLRRCRLPFSSWILSTPSSLTAKPPKDIHEMSCQTIAPSAHTYISLLTRRSPPPTADAHKNRNFPQIVKNAQAMPPTMSIYSYSPRLIVCFALDFPFATASVDTVAKIVINC